MNQCLIKLISLLTIFLCYFNYSFSILLKEITETKKTKDYSYFISLPYIENSSTFYQSRFNEKINDFKIITLNNFLENITHIDSYTKGISSLNIKSNIFKTDFKISSIFIQGSWYFNDIHGEPLIKTYNLNSQSGKILSITDIINPKGIKYLEDKIQNNIIQNLNSKSEAKLYFSKARANLEKAHIFFKKDKIIIIFDSFVLGPASSGTPTFEFALQSIKQYLII